MMNTHEIGGLVCKEGKAEWGKGLRVGEGNIRAAG